MASEEDKKTALLGGRRKSELIHPPVNVFGGDSVGGFYGGGYQSSVGGSGGIQYERLSFEMLHDIDRRLGVLCTLLEDISVSLGVVAERTGVLQKPKVIDRSVVGPAEVMNKETTMLDCKTILAGKEGHDSD